MILARAEPDHNVIGAGDLGPSQMEDLRPMVSDGLRFVGFTSSGFVLEAFDGALLRSTIGLE